MTQNQPTNKQTRQKPKTANLLTELVVCLIIPTLVLKKLSGEEHLGTVYALILALSFPLCFGIYDFIKSKKIAFVPALGFISILLTGGIGLLKLDTAYIAIKEAAIPFVIGVVTLLSANTKKPLVKVFIYNDILLDTDKVSHALETKNKQPEFEQIMRKATWLLGFTFFLSAILNYFLAKYIVVSPAGTEAFNDELGTMTLVSYPVIALPSLIITFYALYYIISNIKKLTGLGLEDIVHQ